MNMKLVYILLEQLYKLERVANANIPTFSGGLKCSLQCWLSHSVCTKKPLKKHLYIHAFNRCFYPQQHAFPGNPVHDFGFAIEQERKSLRKHLQCKMATSLRKHIHPQTNKQALCISLVETERCVWMSHSL